MNIFQNRFSIIFWRIWMISFMFVFLLRNFSLRHRRIRPINWRKIGHSNLIWVLFQFASTFAFGQMNWLSFCASENTAIIFHKISSVFLSWITITLSWVSISFSRIWISFRNVDRRSSFFFRSFWGQRWRNQIYPSLMSLWENYCIHQTVCLILC